MFESDDFDQVLSQFDFPEVVSAKPREKQNRSPDHSQNICESQGLKTRNPFSQNVSKVTVVSPKPILKESVNVSSSHNIKCVSNTTEQIDKDCPLILNKFVSPKHTKRKIINSYFDHQSKRKFPGPAGLLTGTLQEPKDESICQIELLSQDLDYTQNNLQRGLFDSPIWRRLLSDMGDWKLNDVDNISTIKQQALAGNLRKRKAQTVTGFVEAVDRSATDPLIILRDVTGTIKCTLHRDAWSTFSAYIVSEYCALVLQKPTVLTTGSAFKKHYLNITLGNIMAIYSATVLNEDAKKALPDNYSILYEEDFTVIIANRVPDTLGTSLELSRAAEEDLFDGLDSIFSDDVFEDT